MMGLAVVALLAAPVPASDADALARVDLFVATEMRRARIPGMAVAVVKDARVVLAQGYGLANVEQDAPVTGKTVFQSGSMGKQFLATAVVLLAEDGRLSLDDPLAKFFPAAPESWKRITVRHLLSHTSGMQDYPDDYDLRRDYTEDEQLAMVQRTPLASAPGVRWSYSNLGYVTLGVLVHRVTGKFYGDFLAERIFTPLGMTRSRVISEADIVPHRAAGYRIAGGELKNQEWVSPSVNTTGDGSLYLTLDDLLKWEGGLDAGRPLGKPVLERMWTPAVLNDGTRARYGFGWFVTDAGGRRLLFHGGAWQGFKSMIARFPDDRLTVLFFANLWEANEWRILRGIASAFIPSLALDHAPPLPDAEPEVTSLARKVLRQLAARAPDRALFTPEAGAALGPDRVEALAARLEGLTLPPAMIGTIDLVERSEQAGLRTYRYSLTDLDATDVFSMRLTTDGTVAGLDLTSRRRRSATPGSGR
jgi:CubicO group peptidase (beta-lactamase class C family)